jgi:hypothetical protein
MTASHGPQDPARVTPRRRPRSVRRTTSIDMAFPDGLAGDVLLSGRGRDLATDARGATRVVDRASFEAVIDFAHGQRVTEIVTSPPIEGLDALVGRGAGGGYRKYLNEVVAQHDLSGSLQFQLLDDLSGASLVSGYAPQLALAHRGEHDAEEQIAESADATQIMLAMGDVCAGWRSGGTIMTSVESSGRPPMLQGPPAPVLDDLGDPDAWHDVASELMPNGMRRIRRIDVTGGREAGAPLTVDSMFRDTHMDRAGAVTIVHEYQLVAEIEPETFTVLSIDATPRVLPYYECPEAAASATRVIGSTTLGLRARTRTEFVGASTCTHLNDVLRALEDVEHLAHSIDQEDAR